MNELYLPLRFAERLKKLTILPNEINGVLLYRGIDAKDVVLASQILGYNASDAYTTTSRGHMGIINEFLQSNPEYDFVEFHTHTEQTIRKYGENYARNLSMGDINTIIKNYADDSRYRHLLVTPKVLKLHAVAGREIVPAGFILIPNVDENGSLEREIDNAIMAIHRRKGIAPLEIRV